MSKVWRSRSRLLQTWRFEIAGAPEPPGTGASFFCGHSTSYISPMIGSHLTEVWAEEFPFTKSFRGSLVRSRLSHIKFAKGSARDRYIPIDFSHNLRMPNARRWIAEFWGYAPIEREHFKNCRSVPRRSRAPITNQTNIKQTTRGVQN